MICASYFSKNPRLFIKDIRQKCIKEGSNGIVFVVKIENISLKCIKGKSLMHSNLIFDTNGIGKYCNAVYQYISSFYSVERVWN